MTTINNYSVSLALDADNYIRNSTLSRKETASLRREINQARTPADNYERSISRIEKALQAGAIDQKVYNRLMDEAKHRFDRASMAGKEYSSALHRMGSSLKTAIAAYVGFSTAINQVKGGLTDLMNAEQAKIQFEVLAGSAELGIDALNDLREFAASTPFQFEQIADAGRQLLAFKFSTDELGSAMTMLGNLSAGTGSDIGELAAIIGKARVQGRLFNEDINQLTGRGINVIDGLAAKFGDVKKAAEQGKISFDDLYEVLQGLTSEGGQFAGLMEKLGASTAGKVSTLTDEYKALRMELSEQLLPAMNKLMEAALFHIKLLRGESADSILGVDAANERKAQAESDLATRKFMKEHGIDTGILQQARDMLGGKVPAQEEGAKIGEAIGKFAFGSGSSLFSGFKGVASQLMDAATFQMDVWGNMIQVQQNKERADREQRRAIDMDALAPSAARGSQEAYKIITQARNAHEQKVEQQNERQTGLLADVSQTAGQMLAELMKLAPVEVM